MKVGVLDTGPVGRAVATRLVELGHPVVPGGRSSVTRPAAARFNLRTVRV